MDQEYPSFIVIITVYPADFFEKTAGKWEGEILIRENLNYCLIYQ